MHLIKRVVQIILGIFALGLILSTIFSGGISGFSHSDIAFLAEPVIMILIIFGLEKLPSKSGAKPLTLSKILMILGFLIGLGLILGVAYLIYGLNKGGLS